MPTYEHIAIANRWLDSLLDMTAPQPFEGRKCRQMHASGNVLNSWGSHFPLVRMLYTAKGKPRGLLLNGDTWTGAMGWAASAGNSTTNHQSAVLAMAETSGLPYVTVPQSVLNAAGIDSTTVVLVHRTDDWYENRTEEFEAEPEGSRWVYEDREIPGTDGWVNHRTGEFVKRGWVGNRWVHQPPGEPDYHPFTSAVRYDEPEYKEAWALYQAARRRWQSEWVNVPSVTRRTGRRTLHLRSGQALEQYVRADGSIGSRYHWRRHWLGEALIKAQIPYAAEVKCQQCKGTGLFPHIEALPGAEGPLTERQDAVWNRWHTDGDPRLSIGSRIEERCDTCLGRRRVRTTRMRTAYFLSGFDHNEPRPSYFFTELPPDARPKTIDEAYAALKPATVRLAEEMGRTVLRQGDQFFIEMPDLTLRELKRQGAEHHRRGGPGREKQQWEREDRPAWASKPRFQRYINENCWLGGTTHEATEVVRLGGATYVRGIVRHVPDGRAPDHVPLRLGTKTLWLNVPNRTPVGR